MLSYSFGDATFCIHCYHVHLTCYPLEVLCINNNGLCFFFKRKTAYEFRIGDWSSDVCSSDLRRRCASRRGPRLTPSCLASFGSLMRVPGLSSPEMMACVRCATTRSASV